MLHLQYNFLVIVSLRRIRVLHHLIYYQNNPHLFIDKRCEHLIHDLSTRIYKPGTRDAADSGDQGQITDALGYYLYSVWPLGINIKGQQIVTITAGV